MWLIPGKTKVNTEIFKGIGIIDMLVGAVFVLLSALLLLSNIPGRFIITLVVISIAFILLVKIDDEANYIFLNNIFVNASQIRHYRKSKTMKEILSSYAVYEGEDAPVGENAEVGADAKGDISLEDAPHVETKEEKKARLLAEEKEYKEEEKRLKSKDLTKEEEDAIWKRRAERSALKSKEKKLNKDSKAAWGDTKDITAFTGIHDNRIEYAGQYYGRVIEIFPVEFRFFSKARKYASINNGLGKILRSINPEFSANIVKIERPVHYEGYIEEEKKKIQALRQAFENGMLSEDELKNRVEVIYNRMLELDSLMSDKKVIVPCFYLCLFDSDKNQLDRQIREAYNSLQQAELTVHVLDTKELAVFLKYTNSRDVDESEIDRLEEKDYALWAQPDEVSFRVRTTEVNRIATHTMRIASYPMVAPDAWLASVMSIPGTKCVIKAKPMDMSKSVRAIDRSLAELRSQYRSTTTDSKLIELSSHIESLGELLNMLQGGNESLLQCNVYVTGYDLEMTQENPTLEAPKNTNIPFVANMKKTLRRVYNENNLKLVNMDFRQIDAYVATQVSGYDPYEKEGRGMPANSISAAYPWVFATVSDKSGFKLGLQDGVPVFIDFFRRDSERINSNMVIVGKSGSGKSYATKSLLANLAADDTKIFILDPENEYKELADNLHGKMINVGNAQYGRLNPFHIMTVLEDDDADSSGVSGSYSTHLQFLEEFFKQIIPDCDKDAMEYLNSIVDRMYLEAGITAETDLSKLKPEDYPVFDDLYDAILEEFQRSENEYIRSLLRTLMNYIAKFSTGGRNANIWNGPSTITTDENFTVFNFQSMLSNRNSLIANAQMLLVLKYIDNEIIKNREYNVKNNMNRKVVVVIDEAHVFIDEKFPIALDFMFQLAKRIRKYNGMQIVITQNIKDFVGTEELSRKSTAIINACQYSLIFPLSPNDMTDLCKLYEKAGGINESEQEGIVQAARGQAFAILSPTSRSSFKIEVPDEVRDIFSKSGHISEFYGDDPENEKWVEFLGVSRYKHDESLLERKRIEAEENEEAEEAVSHVSFEEFTEEEYERDASGDEYVSSVSFEEIEEKADEGVSSVHFEEIDGLDDEDETGVHFEEVTESNSGVHFEEMDEADLDETDADSDDEEADVKDKKSSNATDSSKSDDDRFRRILKMTEENTRLNSEMVLKSNQELKASLAARDEQNMQTQLLMSNILEKLTAGQVNQDIQTMIESEVQKRVAEALAAMGLGAAGLGALGAAGSALSGLGTAGTASTDSDSFDFDSFGGDDTAALGNEEDDSDSSGEQGGVSLGSIFDLDGDPFAEALAEEEANASADSDDSDGFDSLFDDDDDDDDGFDIMALLMEEAKTMQNISVIEQMDMYDETVADITLEDLILYISNAKNRE